MVCDRKLWDMDGRELMKVLAAFLVLALTSPASAFTPSLVGGSVTAAAGGGATCNTLAEQCSNTTDAQQNMCQYTSTDWYATKFVAAETSARCGIVLPLEKVNAPAMGVIVEIWSDDGGSPSKPNAKLGTSSASVSASTFGGEISFEDIAADLTATTAYWIVLKCDAASATNYFTWGRADGCTTENYALSADGATWTTQGTARSMKFKAYK